jgi:hypothetical protein
VISEIWKRALDRDAKGFLDGPGVNRFTDAATARGAQSAMKQFVVRASWDADARVWWAQNDELPLTTEAPTFDELVQRVFDIAPEMAEMNGHATQGEHVEIQVTAARSQEVAIEPH